MICTSANSDHSNSQKSTQSQRHGVHPAEPEAESKARVRHVPGKARMRDVGTSPSVHRVGLATT